MNKPCSKNTSFSFTKCMQKFVKQKSGCDIDLLSDTDDKCTTNAFVQYASILGITVNSSLTNLISLSRCLPKCIIWKFDVVSEKKTNIDWLVEYNSSFYLNLQAPKYLNIEEQFEYSMLNFTSDFGSFLGLFLGWSCLSIIGNSVIWFRRFFDCVKSKKNLLA